MALHHRQTNRALRTLRSPQRSARKHQLRQRPRLRQRPQAVPSPNGCRLASRASSVDYLTRHRWRGLQIAQVKSPLRYDSIHPDDAASVSRGWEYEATARIAASFTSAVPPAGQPPIIMLGSSHARVLCAPIAAYAQQHNLPFISYAATGIGITTEQPTAWTVDGPQLNAQRVRLIKHLQPQVLVIAGMWSTELYDDQQFTILQQRRIGRGLQRSSALI